VPNATRATNANHRDAVESAPIILVGTMRRPV
jgi:hypothetical protein